MHTAAYRPTTANDRQVGGSHYACQAVQPWAAMEAWMPQPAFAGFLLGSAIAYLARVHTAGVPGKGGRLDVEKARHYLDKLLEVMGGDQEADSGQGVSCQDTERA